ncbi:MAG: hypothetical protein ACOYU3_01130 [Bacillota bacterium]
MNTITRFKSKQNDVSLVADETLPEGICIEKRFYDRVKKQKEIKINGRVQSSGLAAPRVLGKSKDTIRYEYIEGKTLCALLDEAEASDCETQILPAFFRLCDWLRTFQSATGMIFFDINLRNFIVSNGELYGFDYEDARSGRIETDFGRLLAFILTYDPAFSVLKMQLCRRLLRYISEDAGINEATVLSEMKNELETMKTRRSAEYAMQPDAAVTAIEEGNAI